ncbi:MAG: DUF4139 domain-containing protein [Bacteroidota bacterium]
MKKSAIITLLLFITFTAVVAQKEIKTPSKINKVIVYRSGAQIFRKADVNIPAGTSKIIISGLSSRLNPNSLRVSGKGNFVILEQQSVIKYPEPEEVKESEIPQHILNKIKAYTDSLEMLQYDIDENNAKRDLLISEKNLLQNSKAITKTDTITVLKEALLYYRSRMAEINADWFKVKKRERLLSKTQVGYQAKLAELNDYQVKTTPIVNTTEEKPESIITITVTAETAVQNASIFFSYLATPAGWSPIYELKVDEVSKPVQLTMKAIVTQNTDEDWSKVNLTLSTGTPMTNKTLPIINPWFLTYYMNPNNIGTSNMKMATGRSAETVATSMAGVQGNDGETGNVRGSRSDGTVIYIDGVKDASYSTAYVEQNTNLINTEYDISLPYEIPSDAKPHTITILKENLTGIYKYVAIPKVDKEAFLTAALVGWEKLNLIPATANIIFENSIIGQTFINPVTSNDTLTVSLGTDKRIFVERKKLSDKTKDNIVGNVRKRNIKIEITVKNQNLTAIELGLKDQFPISNVADIKIETSEVKDAEVNAESGIIEWKLNLKPGESKKVTFNYIISWDKSKPLLTE